MTSSFTNTISVKEQKDLKLQLESFVVEHAAHHRPLALVTSGGTAVDIDGVRSIENFSTGYRGACSVEQFLKRGYAVIHLHRIGSTAPYARVLQQHMSSSSDGGNGANGGNNLAIGIDVENLGKIFADRKEEEIINSVVSGSDPFLTTPDESHTASAPSDETVRLHRSLMHSTAMERALKERDTALSQGRLLTVRFQYVQEYLSKLQIATQALADMNALALVYLAAAVSDFYVPTHQKRDHKIQSSAQGLTLRLQPVPKVVGLVRQQWAPNAFLVTFKLETDEKLLQEKVHQTVERYGCNLIIGNLLSTRHQQVHLWCPPTQARPADPQDWSATTLSKTSHHADSLEILLVESVVEQHFEYLSYHYHAHGAEASERSHRLLQEKRQRVQRELFWKKVMNTGVELVTAVIAMGLSYTVNQALQRRLRG